MNSTSRNSAASISAHPSNEPPSTTTTCGDSSGQFRRMDRRHSRRRSFEFQLTIRMETVGSVDKAVSLQLLVDEGRQRSQRLEQLTRDLVVVDGDAEVLLE